MLERDVLQQRVLNPIVGPIPGNAERHPPSAAVSEAAGSCCAAMRFGGCQSVLLGIAVGGSRCARLSAAWYDNRLCVTGRSEPCPAT